MCLLNETYASAQSDRATREAVLQELRRDPRVDCRRLDVTVTHGVVTLTGMVEDYTARRAAAEAAERAPGVDDVLNRIVVSLAEGCAREDEDLVRDVCGALAGCAADRFDDFGVGVRGGVVTLTGTVPRLQDRATAEQVIRSLPGVRGMVGEVRVGPGESSPEELRSAVDDILRRLAPGEWGRIAVGVSDGRVCLDGRVQSWLEKMALRGAVGRIPGVRSVEDRLQIDPSL